MRRALARRRKSYFCGTSIVAKAENEKKPLGLTNQGKSGFVIEDIPKSTITQSI